MTVHRAAGSGYATGAEAYRRGRPSYPAATVELVRRVADGRVVVDVGAGTGAFCSLLTDLRVVAIEPVAEMIARIPPRGSRAQAEATGLPLRDGVAGVVTAAQAFHWFASTAALDELRRVLQPDGRLLLVWNVRDESVPWVARHSALVDRHAGDAPRYASLQWRQVLDASGRFELEEEHVEPNPTPMTRERLVDRVLSTSFIAALDEPAKRAVAAEAADLAASLPERFDYPYVTKAFVLKPR